MEQLGQRPAIGAGWIIGVGVLMVVLGALAIVVPPLASLATTLVVGVILLASGVVQLVHAYRGWGGRSSGWTVAGGLIRLAAGALIIYRPLAGTYALSIVLATYLLVVGALKIADAFERRRYISWGWLLVDGIVSVILGAMVWAGLPLTALWIVGLFVGIELVFAGMATIALAMSVPIRPRV